MPEADSISKFVLDNGVRVLLDRDTRFSTAGLAICLLGGLRDEKRAEIGLTHLLEHLLFKRTSGKSTLEIAAAIDDFGGDVNAFTDADSLCLYGAVPSGRIFKLLQFLAEVTKDSAFTARDLELEKEVIRQEIQESDDDPGSVAYQSFSECFWPHSTLGCPVFGTAATVSGFTERDVWRRRDELLAGNRLIVAAVGNIDADSFVAEVAANFSHLPAGRPVSFPPEATAHGWRKVERPVGQIYFTLGTAWPDLKSDKFYDAVVAAGILGSGMSSRLFQLLREEHGLAYDIGAEVNAFDNTGALVIDGIVDPSTLGQALNLVRGELSALSLGRLSDEEIARTVQMNIAQLEMERDSAKGRLWRLVESEQTFGEYRSSAREIDRFRQVSTRTVGEFLQRWLAQAKFTLVLCGPTADIGISPELKRLCED